MELDHFSHEHPLILYEDPKDCVEELPCFGCSLPLSSPAYKCSQCDFFLHKSCAQLPNKIIHFLHPRHPLTLFLKSPYGHNSVCDNCSEFIYGFSYHCSFCKFDLDIKCVLLQPIVEHEGHQHSFMLLRPTPFTCDACGETDNNCMSYLCSTCQLMLHKNCASLPDTIKHKAHPHPFTLAQPTTTTQVCSCKLCGETMDPRYLGYECVTCTNDSGGSEFKTHVRCTTPKHQLDEDDTMNTTIVGDDENNEPHQTANDDSLVVGMTRLVVENERVVEVEHFSHQHCLTLTLSGNEEDPENDDICEGCTRSISAPFYKCGQCKFFLHVSCAELPRRMLHPLHPHPLTLLAQADSKCGVFRCDACRFWSNGFRYNCDKCEINFDVRCTSFSKTLKHRNHEHILNLDKKYNESNCSACGVSSFRPKFRCDDCDFSLDLGCVSLPYEVRHRWDKHPLNLTFYSVVEEEEEEESSREYYCEICEEEIRDPTKWFYHCEECNFCIHPKCIIWANMIKFGKKGKNYCRPSHFLCLQYCRIRRPVCYICDQPCTDRYAVECANCNFFIHRLR